jgi:hypothetical protein
MIVRLAVRVLERRVVNTALNQTLVAAVVELAIGMRYS